MVDSQVSMLEMLAEGGAAPPERVEMVKQRRAELQQTLTAREDAGAATFQIRQLLTLLQESLGSAD